jgi:hypothetical protein
MVWETSADFKKEIMPKYRKKPVVIEAERFSKDEALPFRDTGSPVQFGCECDTNSTCTFCGKFYIETLEGRHIVSEGDMVIRGVKGEFYPCKPDIFERTYQIDEPETTDTTGQVFTYTKNARFGVVNKLPYNQRFQCNFKYLHETRELAEKEALRLTAKYGHKYYIVEIQAITNAEQADERSRA